MKTKIIIKNLVTMLLFVSFLLTYFLNLTGLKMHQWLGIAAAAVAVLHLFMHWNWVKTVTSRFFNHCTVQARINYLLDALLFTGLTVITLTGLTISSWINLAVSSYDSWRFIHVTASLAAMVALVLKVALHWKYIAAAFKLSRSLQPSRINSTVNSEKGMVPKLVSRREALRVIGSVSVIGVVSILKATSALRTAEAASLPQPALNTQAYQSANFAVSSQPTATSTPTYQPATSAQIAQAPAASQPSNTVSENCVVRCDKGCLFPGRCRRYTDANNNQRCDLGECLAV